MSMKKVVVKQVPEKEVPIEVLAESIKAIADGVRRLRAGRMNDRALFLLVQHAAPSVGARYGKPITIAQVKAVFQGIDALESEYLRKRP